MPAIIAYTRAVRRRVPALIFAVTMVTMVMAGGCKRPVRIRPADLAHLAPSPERGSPRRGWREHWVPVTRFDGRTVLLRQDADALLVPLHGPARLFLRPIAARVEDDTLIIAGSNRPSSRIRLSDIDSVTIYR